MSGIFILLMAEATGFEPAKGVSLYTLSKRAPSTTRPHFQCLDYNTKNGDWAKIEDGESKIAIVVSLRIDAGAVEVEMKSVRSISPGGLRPIVAVAAGTAQCTIGWMNIPAPHIV